MDDTQQKGLPMTTTIRFALGSVLLLLLPLHTALAATTTLTWHGHATFQITTPKGKVLMIDPWLKNPTNPKAKNGKDPLADIKQVDYILITHGHSDHVGDAVPLGTPGGQF
jgi:L-ascorbate metabolism protein UlaG (beta-lactamase superfamily)